LIEDVLVGIQWLFCRMGQDETCQFKPVVKEVIPAGDTGRPHDFEARSRVGHGAQRTKRSAKPEPAQIPERSNLF
jgi:hypothetical protein